MTDNQTCYICEQPCRPGRGITDEGGRRHIECPPVPDPAKVERKRLAMVKARSMRHAQARTQGSGIVEGGQS